MKLTLPRDTRERIAQEMINEPIYSDREGLSDAAKVAEYGYKLDEAQYDDKGRLDLPASVWNEVIQRLSWYESEYHNTKED